MIPDGAGPGQYDSLADEPMRRLGFFAVRILDPKLARPISRPVGKSGRILPCNDLGVSLDAVPKCRAVPNGRSCS
jgi:hypothetical protein